MRPHPRQPYTHRWLYPDPTIEVDAIRHATNTLPDLKPQWSIHRREWTFDGLWLTLTAELHLWTPSRSCPTCNLKNLPHWRFYDPAPLARYGEDTRLTDNDRKALRVATSRGKIREDLADRIACRLGLHPALFWPEWFEEVAA